MPLVIKGLKHENLNALSQLKGRKKTFRDETWISTTKVKMHFFDLEWPWKVYIIILTLRFSGVHGWLSISKGVKAAMEKSKNMSKNFQ